MCLSVITFHYSYKEHFFHLIVHIELYEVNNCVKMILIVEDIKYISCSIKYYYYRLLIEANYKNTRIGYNIYNR